VNAQSLPSLLPLGWSPAQAFWVEFAKEPSGTGVLNIGLWGTIASPSVTLVKWEEPLAAWTVLASQPAGTNMTFPIGGSGAFAVVAPDSGLYAPAPPVIGEPLLGTSIGFDHWQSLQATGTVTPSTAPANRIAELVRVSAEIIVTNAAGAIPSGLVLRCLVDEQYAMAEGSFRVLPRYETHVVAYRQPGDRNANTAVATFPMQPLWLLGGDELKQADVKVAVFAPAPFSGGVLGRNAGQLSSGDVRLIASAAGGSSQVTIELNLISPTNFVSLTGTNVVRAFQLGMGTLAEERQWAAQFGPGGSNAFYVLARVISRNGLYGAEPVERFATDARGMFSSVEPISGQRLKGITESGQYILVRVGGPEGIVTGIARNAQNQAAPGLPIRAQDGPWLTFSEANGFFRTIAPVGTSQVGVTDLATGDTTVSPVLITDWQQPVDVSVSALPSAPHVVAVSPAGGATNVSVVAPITIEFSEPINPGSLLPNEIVLHGTNGPVTASLTLNLRGNVASLLPTDALAANATHTILVSSNVSDLTGLKLEGANVFTFKTRSDELNRGLGAQVISFEPTNGVARIEGTQGIAESGMAVILVNDTTGETSTVLSKPDGSFQGEIRATADDFLSAVFVNSNGSRNVMPVSRQFFTDGRIGLFNGGGILEAEGENGPVQVLVEPGSVPNKTIFKIDPVAMADLPPFAARRSRRRRPWRASRCLRCGAIAMRIAFRPDR
jgi:hypothetical protein